MQQALYHMQEEKEVTEKVAYEKSLKWTVTKMMKMESKSIIQALGSYWFESYVMAKFFCCHRCQTARTARQVNETEWKPSLCRLFTSPIIRSVDYVEVGSRLVWAVHLYCLFKQSIYLSGPFIYCMPTCIVSLLCGIYVHVRLCWNWWYHF